MKLIYLELPTYVPDDAKYVATDEGGTIHVFTSRPIVGDTRWTMASQPFLIAYGPPRADCKSSLKALEFKPVVKARLRRKATRKKK